MTITSAPQQRPKTKLKPGPKPKGFTLSRSARLNERQAQAWAHVGGEPWLRATLDAVKLPTTV